MSRELLDREAVTAVLEPLESLAEVTVPLRGSGHSEFVVRSADEERPGLWWRAIDTEYYVDQAALEGALSKVPGLSGPAVREWPASLLLPPLNWWYSQADGQVRALTTVEEGRPTVVQFTKKESPLNSTLRMLETAEQALAERGVEVGTLQYDRVGASLDRASVAIVAPGVTEEVKEGDVVSAGIFFINSPVGTKKIELSPYVNRLICTNGWISPVNMASFSIKGGDGGSMDEWVQSATFSAWDAVSGEIDQIRGLTEVPIDGHHTDVLRDIFERHGVASRLRERVVEAYAEENDGTMFGIANAFNRAANDVTDIGQVRNLMMVSGEVAHQSERCSACLRALN